MQKQEADQKKYQAEVKYLKQKIALQYKSDETGLIYTFNRGTVDETSEFIFDTDTFTVAGKKLTSYLADIDDDGTYSHETEVIANGYFHESEYRSAPAFDIDIDGITLINE